MMRRAFRLAQYEDLGMSMLAADRLDTKRAWRGHDEEMWVANMWEDLVTLAATMMKLKISGKMDLEGG